MTEVTYHRGDQPADEFDRDLNPDGFAGRNVDMQGPHPEKNPNVRTAFDMKGIHNRLQGMGDAELQRIPIMPEGSRLEQGATYIDLREPNPREFTAAGDITAGPDNAFVPKTEVDYPVWNRLIGVQNPERLVNADDR